VIRAKSGKIRDTPRCAASSPGGDSGRDLFAGRNHDEQDVVDDDNDDDNDDNDDDVDEGKRECGRLSRPFAAREPPG